MVINMNESRLTTIEQLEQTLGGSGAVEVPRPNQVWSKDITYIHVYLKGYATMGERMHQSQGNLTPDAVYAKAHGGGGAMILVALVARLEIELQQ
jgi:hypothetical protein